MWWCIKVDFSDCCVEWWPENLEEAFSGIGMSNHCNYFYLSKCVIQTLETLIVSFSFEALKEKQWPHEPHNVSRLTASRQTWKGKDEAYQVSTSSCVQKSRGTKLFQWRQIYIETWNRYYFSSSPSSMINWHLVPTIIMNANKDHGMRKRDGK